MCVCACVCVRVCVRVCVWVIGWVGAACVINKKKKETKTHLCIVSQARPNTFIKISMLCYIDENWDKSGTHAMDVVQTIYFRSLGMRP